uniref:UDP-glucuronosyltransferase n=1 Tax=Neogobius melanostomus TaxID=47308 RepID=A0A8C6WU35_9GOBI
ETCVSLLVSTKTCALGGVAWAGHVLVFPGEFSHWLNMRHLVEELQVRNHSISIMVPSATEVPLHLSRGVAAAEGQLRAGFMQLSMELQIQTCEAMVRNVTLMSQLRSAHFDGVLWDPMSPCGDLVAQLLDLPLIASLRLSFGAVIERHCGHAPLPPSYVPASPLPYSDHMTFSERVKNVGLFQDVQYSHFERAILFKAVILIYCIYRPTESYIIIVVCYRLVLWD